MSQNRSNRMQAAAFAAIETLEQHRLLSSVVSHLIPDPVNIGKNTLKVTGTSGNDYINVYEDLANNYAEVFNDKSHNGVENSGEVSFPNPVNLIAQSATAKLAIIPSVYSDVNFGPSNGIILDGGRRTDKYDTAQYLLFGRIPTVNFIIRAVETLDASLLPALPPILLP